MNVTAAMTLCIASVFALVACASGTEASSSADPPTEQATLQATASCDLHKAVSFAAPACDSCMQDKCCVQTTVCFSGNPDCVALHACLIKCPADHPVGVPESPGAPVDSKMKREVENPCAAACEEAYPSAVVKHNAYDSCIRTQCMPACAT
jgi:hypothetical protein